MTAALNRPTGTNACSNGKTKGQQIAVFIDSRQLPSAPHEAACLVFYSKQDGQWIEAKRKPVQPMQGEAQPAVRKFIEQIVSLTADAQAVAGSSISGRIYTALNKQGKHIFEITAINPQQLSGIAEDIAMVQAKKALAEEVFTKTRPTETDVAGIYSLDLVTALEDYPELSSKMILKPFMNSTPYIEITVICRHIPHWLLLEKNLRITQKQRGEYLVVSIQKQFCGEAV